MDDGLPVLYAREWAAGANGAFVTHGLATFLCLISSWCICCAAIDALATRSACIAASRCQPQAKTDDPVPRALARRAVARNWTAVLFQTVIFAPLFKLAFPRHAALASWSPTIVTSPTHEPLSFWAFFGVWFVTNDLIFTAFHTCFHMWPWLYRLVHKEHHTWKAPFSWMSHAMSLYELAANGVAVMFWPLFHSLVLGRPTAIELVWFVQCFSQLIGCIEHSGYDAIPPLVLPMNLWFPSIFSNTKHHDDHHRAFNGNYGGYLCVWDNMMGTALKLDAV
jgi:sterol desaturase/sphingolipid hydroxylase (fatty acid hydroxylase superfamily)